MLRGTVLAVLSCALAVNLHAQTYYLMSNMANGDWGPPLPMNPCASCPVYSVGSNNYWIDDRSELGLSSMSFSAMSADGIDPGDTNNLATNSNGQGIISPMDLPYTTNGSLWIEAYSNDTQNIYLQLHNTTNAYLYQIFSTTNLLLPSASWTPGQAQVGKSDTNLTPFDAIPMTNGQAFFRGQQGNTVIFVDYATVAYESNSDVGTPAQPGYIEFSAQPGVDNSLAVHYTLGGSARNGVDYTNLSGVATIPGNGNNTVQVYVQPISPSTLTNSIETVDFTVQPSTDYLVASSQSSGTVLIKSSSTTVGVDAGTNAVRPIAPGFPARDGNFTLYRNDDFGLNPPLTVQYQVSGTASNGLDYQLLSGSIAFAQDSTSTNLDVTPLAESPLQGTKTLTLTVLGTTDYAAASNSFTRTIDIDDRKRHA